MRILLLGFCLALFCAPAIQAQIAVGAIAPEIPKTKWLNTKKPLSLEDLRGRVIVLIFWKAEDTASMLDGTPFVDWWKPLDEQGAVYITLSEDPAELIAPILEAKAIPLAVATSSKASQLYLPGEESMAFIVAWDGRIVWRGSPRSKDLRRVIEAQIKLGLSLDKTFDPRPLNDKRWDKYVKACLADNLSKAQKVLEKMAVGKHEDLAIDAMGYQFALTLHVTDRVEYAFRIAAESRAHEASMLIEESAKVYRNHDVGDGLKKDIKVLEERYKDFLSLDKKRVLALEKAFKGDRDGALKRLNALLPKAKNAKVKLLLEREINRLKTMGVISKEE